MNIDYYLSKEYDRYPCWDMVCEFYTREMNVTLKEFPSKQDYRSIAKAFKQAIMEYQMSFEKIEAPVNNCIAMLKYPHADYATHVGIYLNGSILHCTGETRLETVSTIQYTFPHIEYYKLKGAVYD